MRQLFETAVIAAIVALSLRRAVFLVAALLRRRPLPRLAALPSVTVLIPARNERAVAERVLAALARVAYPDDRLRFVLVCDGCVDDTPTIFRRWARDRTDADVVELTQSVGKAAALNAGVRVSDTDIVVVLDADLRPTPDFLLTLVQPFADPDVGAAAAYLRPANADQNLVARYAAVTTWVHQLVTSAGTDRLTLNPPTLGAAAYRRSALLEIDGFPDVPVGEDVATSARLTRRGWRTRFVEGAIVDNTVVSDLRTYWRQHVRWSRAVFRAHSDRQRSSASLAQRVELTAASLGYADRLVFALALAGASVGTLPAWVPLLYLAVPGLEILAALGKAGVRQRLPWFVVSAVLFFVADILASMAAVVIHLARRPYRWHNARWAPTADTAAP